MTTQKNEQKKPLEYYLGLAYPIEVQPAEEGGYVVSIPELPGCLTQVETWEEAKSSINEVRQEWIKAAYEDNAEIPLPKDKKEYSGKFVVRIPKSMHRNLDNLAADEGVSLNTLVISLLSAQLNSPKTLSEASQGNKNFEVDYRILTLKTKSPENERPRIIQQEPLFDSKKYRRIALTSVQHSN
jgi:antitoxin HicB